MNPAYYLYWKEGDVCNFKQFPTRLDLNEYLSRLDVEIVSYVHIVSGFTIEERY